MDRIDADLERRLGSGAPAVERAASVEPGEDLLADHAEHVFGPGRDRACVAVRPIGERRRGLVAAPGRRRQNRSGVLSIQTSPYLISNGLDYQHRCKLRCASEKPRMKTNC